MCLILKQPFWDLYRIFCTKLNFCVKSCYGKLLHTYLWTDGQKDGLTQWIIDTAALYNNAYQSLMISHPPQSPKSNKF